VGGIMKALYIALLIFLIPFTLSAQWEWQNPTPFGNGLFEIQFINDLTGYACGKGGTIIKTTDGGINWNEIDAGTDDLISDIFFLTEDIGWFLTNSENTIYKTTTGGIDWLLIGNLAPRSARSLWFLNDSLGFAGSNPYLLFTSNGGSTWSEISNVYDPYAIFFINSNIGFVGGYNVIYKTTNNGTDWSTVALPTPEFTPREIFALDQNNIFVVGTGFFQGNIYYSFIKTTNGGNTWTGASFEYWLTDVYFTSSSEGWVCSNKIYKTTNGGTSWESTNYSGSRFEFINNKSWSISGWNTIIYSDDFWITANQQIRSVFSGYLWNGAAKDTNIIFACGSNKTIVGSVDGGKTWSKYFESTDQTYLNAVTFNTDDIWAVGNNGVVLHSTNYGNSWEEGSINASGLRDVEFINDSLGYIVGTIWGLACIYATQDGGKSWELQQTFPEFTSIDEIEFSRDNLGWMIANRDGLLKSTDMGRTWNVVYDLIPWFKDIAVCHDTAWFSFSNKVLRTTDAGNSWETFNVFGYQGTSFWGFEIDFVSSEIGYAGTWDSRIFTTSNGGETWTEEEFPSAMPIYSIDFVDVKRGWTFGEIGTILKRDPNSTNISVDQISVQILSQNYPNPFNPSTTISYQIPELSFVTVKVYDVLGSEIATLINEDKPAGNYEAGFDGTNLTSGIYFYRIQAGNYTETKKMILLK
jgi:photosystem II stability/assembly factor-like uncharacterized protein